jgi:hypothetical protein
MGFDPVYTDCIIIVGCLMTKRSLKESDVLRYNIEKKNNKTVRRYYVNWRNSNKLPERCDNPNCIFYKNPLLWNGEILPLILDHINGNNKDNRPQNLRFLCPNCNSQQPTQGGKNKGRIQNESKLGYQVKHRDGRRDANIFPETLSVSIDLGKVTVNTDESDA